MKNYKVILQSNKNIQEWYVRCNSESIAERLVLDMPGAFAEPNVSIVDGDQDKVDGLDLQPNKPEQYV